MSGNQIALFKGRKVRKTIHNKEWWFVIEDVVSILTDSVQPSGYIKDMRRRDPELSKGWGQIAPLSIETLGGARKKLERRLKRSIVSKNNYLKTPEMAKLK